VEGIEDILMRKRSLSSRIDGQGKTTTNHGRNRREISNVLQATTELHEVQRSKTAGSGHDDFIGVDIVVGERREERGVLMEIRTEMTIRDVTITKTISKTSEVDTIERDATRLLSDTTGIEAGIHHREGADVDVTIVERGEGQRGLLSVTGQDDVHQAFGVQVLEDAR
jgi:hypothetical protein